MLRYIFAIVAVAILGCSVSSWADETACADEYERWLSSDMGLSYDEFDQTRGMGFRRLTTLKCWKEAADLIEAYIAATGAQENSLIWHMAQMRAAQGDYPAAIAYARKSLRPPQDFKDRPLRWNDYVLAVIAFLERDEEALLRHRNAVAEGVGEYYGNEMNLKVIDALIANFDETYVVASSRIGATHATAKGQGK